MSKSPLQRLAIEKAQAFRSSDQERRAQASRALVEAKLEAYIESVVADAPPLTTQQIHRLTGLLRSGGQR